ncbi:PREDICTED: gamma-tubulin complex component 4-like [Priapulus caudatus]|uniref:Gamma-tubulin complex component n=1 Tax=Priapulus caudatus TaxID=37621 RepID=A0ABM1EH59_PRICU|nr:PREDICTED: gamma-tubulin complex component 4-like [Priapulus caudatus]
MKTFCGFSTFVLGEFFIYAINMLHELLLALHGYPGSIFNVQEHGNLENPCTSLSSMQVVKGLPFLHPSEVAVLDRVLQLGAWYKCFKDFIENYKFAPNVNKTSGDKDARFLRGLYLQAFCGGLDEVLEPYRCQLLELEKDFMSDPHLPVSHVQQALQQYYLLFPALHGVIMEIRAKKVHGCCILDIVHKKSISGSELVSSNLKRILQVCHSVLYRQTTAWVLHGILMDEQKEFFIQEHQPPPSSIQAGGFGRTQTPDRQATVSPAGPLLVLRPQRCCLPTCRCASPEKILLQSANDSPCTMFDGGLLTVFRSQEDSFAQQLLQLQQQPEFSLADFEAVIGKIRACIAERLWKLVVEEADLLTHIQLVKNMYLMGRGELFHAFIDTADNLLRAPPSHTTEHDVNMVFQQVARNIVMGDDSFLDAFYLTVPAPDNKRQDDAGGTETGWSRLGLVYTVDWPLHILFSKPVLDKYNKVFKYLMSVQRAHISLNSCWAMQKQQKHHKCPGILATASWQMHNHMSFLVNNLQYYLMVDVLETQFATLVSKIQSTKDFEAIRLAHDSFLTSIQAQCFLLLKPVSYCIGEILNLCQSFCTLTMSSAVPPTQREHDQLNNISQAFGRQTSLLFKILSRVRNHQSSPHLAQFLMRIDFNKFFTGSGGQLGSAQVNPRSTEGRSKIKSIGGL